MICYKTVSYFYLKEMFYAENQHDFFILSSHTYIWI